MPSISFQNPSVWVSYRGLSVRGQVIGEHGVVPLPELWALLEAAHSYEGLGSIIRRFGGFFALVLEQKDRVLAAVDRVRSVVLWYARRQGVCQ